MKRILLYLSFVVLLLTVLLTDCKKKPELKIYLLEVSNENVVATTSDVTITATYSFPTEIRDIKVVISDNNNLQNASVIDANLNNNSLSATIDNLSASTKYYYCFRYSNGMSVVDTDKRNFTTLPLSEYAIVLLSNPSDGGTVTGGGTYEQGTECTLTATANEGYTFTNWTENGSVVSTNATYTFTVTGDRTLVANFTQNGGGGGDHAYVDLGLPSGLLWATCNVGADTPEDYGDYFAWGETTTKDTYNWSTYQYCNGSSNTLTKYCSQSSYGYNGFTDNLTTLLPEDDAATANWGNGWRMPTNEEFEELYNNTTVTWTTQNGINGRLFTASNGNSLFLPAAGYRYDSSLDFAGRYGDYWSSSLYTGYPDYAWDFYFNSGDYGMYDFDGRYVGQSVRPVRLGQN